MIKTNVIFGATGGIGRAVANQLRKAGESVFLVGRDENKTSQAARELDAAYAILPEISFQGFEHVFEQVEAQGFFPFGVVNCIGSLVLKPAHITTQEEWKNLIDVHLTSSFACIRAAVKKQMREDFGGSIVLISSTAAEIGFANHEAIAAVKAGVRGLAQSAAATYSKNKIRVNCVSPGLTETPLTERITSNAAARAVSEAMHPLGRLGHPDDIASAICWFLNPNNSWVTGQNICVDGGISAIKLK